MINVGPTSNNPFFAQRTSGRTANKRQFAPNQPINAGPMTPPMMGQNQPINQPMMNQPMMNTQQTYQSPINAAPMMSSMSPTRDVGMNIGAIRNTGWQLPGNFQESLNRINADTGGNPLSKQFAKDQLYASSWANRPNRSQFRLG